MEKISDNCYETVITKQSIGAKTAKNGYREELLVRDLINHMLFNLIAKYFLIESHICDARQITGSKKSDLHIPNVQFPNKNTSGINIQIKKTKNREFGQVLRSKVDKLVIVIPGLQKIKYMLTNLCELPIKGILCDNTHKIKKLSQENYSLDQLNMLVATFEENKLDILKYALLGTEEEFMPDLFCISVYRQNKREMIAVWKTIDIINYLFKQKVAIRKSHTVIEIGNLFTFQRKGGDSGHKTANDYQFKFIPTGLLKDAEMTQKAFIYYS